MNTYMYLATSLDGPTIVHLPRYSSIEEVFTNIEGISTKISEDINPIVLKSGYIYSYSKSVGMKGDFLSTHSYISSWRGSNDSKEGHMNYFLQNLVIHRFP
jgi:WD repeat-containing protein 19